MPAAKVLKLMTIDGPSASGKSTLSRMLAQQLGWQWVSTGTFYRAVAFMCYLKGIDRKDIDLIVETWQKGAWQVRCDAHQTTFLWENQDYTEQLLHEDVGLLASQLSQHPKIREMLLEPQRKCFNPQVGLIAEGRDCGTVVFPQAPLKIFLVADSTERARRRSQQLGDLSSVEALKLIDQRDIQDSQRKLAPLRPADGAYEIDTTELSLGEVFDQVWQLVRKTFLEG